MANDPTDTNKFPLGTSDWYAAARNAGDFDKGMNAGNTTFVNRFGKALPTFEKAISDAKSNYGGLNNRGDWVTLRAYAVNDLWQSTADDTWYLVLTAYTSGVDEAADIETGNVQIFQGIARQDAVIKISSVFDIDAFARLEEGDLVDLVEYHVGSNVGGGRGVVAISRHNGGTVISKIRARPDTSNQTEVDDWFLDSGVDELCLVMLDTDIHAESFGFYSGTTEIYNSSALLKAKSTTDAENKTLYTTKQTCTINLDSEFDLYGIEGEATLVWNGNAFSLSNKEKRLSSKEELSSKMRRGDTTYVGFYGDSTVRGIGTTGAENPPTTGTAPDIVPTNPTTEDLNSYCLDGFPQKYQTFARMLYDNTNINTANGAYGGAAISNGWAVKYFDDIFLNSTFTNFNSVEYMLINFAYNDAQYLSPSLTKYKSELIKLIKKCRGFGVEPILMTPDETVKNGGSVALEVQGQLKQALITTAKELDVDVIDVGRETYKIYANNDMIAFGQDQADGVHYNSRGHRIKTSVLLKEIGCSEIFEYTSSELNISPLDRRCGSKSITIQQDSVVTQASLQFGIRHRIATTNFTDGELLIDAWVWSDTDHNALYHMFCTNEYDISTLKTEMPKIVIDNIGVNYDTGSQKTVYTSDLGRPTFGIRVEEKPSIVVLLRAGLSRVRLYAPKLSKITDSNYNLGYFKVVDNKRIGDSYEGKLFDNPLSTVQVSSRVAIPLSANFIIPTVSSPTATVNWPFGNIRSYNSQLIDGTNTVIDFKGVIHNHTGFSFGAGITNSAAPQGYVVRLSGSNLIISYVASTTAGVATVTDLSTATVILGDYNGIYNTYRLSITNSTDDAIGQVITFSRYVSGLPVSIVSWNSEATVSKQVLACSGWGIGGFWDYAGGSGGETLEIAGGTKYVKIT